MEKVQENIALTVIDSTTNVKGNLKIKDDCEIYGKIEGDINSSGNVTLCEGGIIQGNLSSKSAIIAGEITGGVYAPQSLYLKSTAILNKYFRTSKLIIENGAKF